MLRSGDPYSYLVTIVSGFELRFVVKKSSIPEAGLELWVICRCISFLLEHKTHFKLQPGRLVDLGVYGPIHEEDLKSEALFY